jgi:hypothetical protein
MRKPLIVRAFLGAVAAMGLLALGCSTANPTATAFNANLATHPATWAQDHWAEFLKNPNSCKPCHGSTTDTAAAGGTSKVSCFGCHHPNGPHHVAGWADRTQHGRLGAMLASNGQTGFGSTGYAACSRCHGSMYTNPVGVTPSCTACHATAPHAAKPWINAADPLKPNHDMVDQSNAAECAKCHALGANSTIKPVEPAPAGTTPGCFNGTLCHTKAFS